MTTKLSPALMLDPVYEMARALFHASGALGDWDDEHGDPTKWQSTWVDIYQAARRLVVAEMVGSAPMTDEQMLEAIYNAISAPKLTCELAKDALAIVKPTITKLAVENARLRDALTDITAGWRYIRQNHGDLYGVGWDRCEENARAALGDTP